HPPHLHSFPTRRSSDLLFRNRSNTDSSEQTIAWGRARIKSMEATLAAIGEKGLSEKRARLPRKAEAMGDPSILLKHRSRGLNGQDRKSTRLNSSHSQIS